MKEVTPALATIAIHCPTCPTTPPPPDRQRVLFVDDDPLLARLGEHLLRKLGYEPVTATCPAHALRLFQQQPFHAVVTDLTMPRMTGIELAQAVQRIDPSIPVILTTAFRHKIDGKSAASLGFSALLLKPYDLNALGQALLGALNPRTSDLAA